MKLIVDSEKELDKTAREIISYSGEQKIWIFYGEMGAGKTTLIKAIADQLVSQVFWYVQVPAVRRFNVISI